MIAAVARGGIDSANDLREKFSVEIGEEDTQRVSLAGDEAARATVRAVAKSSCYVPDLSARFFAHDVGAAEYA